MFKVLKDFYHLTELYLEDEVREVRADLVAGLVKEGFIDKKPVAAAPVAVPADTVVTEVK